MVDNRDNLSIFACKAIVALMSMSLYIMYFQLDIISAQVAIAFKIPVQSTSIYLEKLFGARAIAFLIGVGLEYIIFVTYTAINTQGPNYTRMIMNEISFGVLLVARIILFITSYSSNLAFHVYISMAFESFGLGCVGGSIFGIVPQHGTVLVLFAHLSRFLTSFVQFILDLIYGQNALAKIRCQLLFCSILTATAITCFYYYNHLSSCQDIKKPSVREEHEKKIDNTCEEQCKKSHEREQYNYIDTFGEAASPFLMRFVGCWLFDILNPGVLPYAFLTTEKCHLVNMLLPFANMVGPSILVYLETVGKFDRWDKPFDSGWIGVIPMEIIFIYSILAVHTRIPSARKIINNRPRVFAMIFVSSLANSFLDPLSFSGVAKVIFMSDKFIGNVGVLMTHQFFTQVNRIFCFKVSVGYNVTRISLGYVFPKFRPNHRMSKWNTFWYILRTTLRKAGRDAINDLKLDVRKYL